MRIMLDTNVLVSALVFGGTVRKVLDVIIKLDWDIYVSEYVDAEFKRILNEKWSDKAEKIYFLYRQMDFIFCKSTHEVLGTLRDKKDIPVLSDALFYGVDILLTGDKDFLESDIKIPLIISPTEFWEFIRKKFFEVNLI